MARRSKLKRRRERQKRRHLQQLKAPVNPVSGEKTTALQLPLRPRISTAKLLELVAQQTSILATVISELEQNQ